MAKARTGDSKRGRSATTPTRPAAIVHDDAPAAPKTETLARRATRAAEAAAEAETLRDLAECRGYGFDPWAGLAERRAAELATLPGPVVSGIGGEVALAQPHDTPGRHFLDTLENPTTTSAAASRARMQQASDHGDGGSLAQALDAAETLGAANSLEKMAAHQLAVCHGMAMHLFKDAGRMIRERGKGQLRGGSEFDAMEYYNVEACRLLATAARLMGAYQNGLATLARVRQGGRQVVTVQHVQVNDGGQAVVAGQVAGGGSGPGGGAAK